MALTVKHLNGDASFMLTFEALLSDQPPFRILIDPWITGKSKIFHSKISVTTHKEPACISSLRELPEPDLVIISQNKSDHCNENSLRQLPAKNSKTIILAEPASARTIRGWKYFERSKVQTIPRWGDPRVTGRQSVVRVRVPSVCPGQVEPGEVTVAFIPQCRDISGLHGAIAITYRAPQAIIPPTRRAYHTLSPPATPRSHKSYARLRPPPTESLSGQSYSTTSTTYPPTPASPTYSTLRSARSASSLATTMRGSCFSTASFSSLDRPLSVIYSPHGINYASLHSYTTSHLVAEAALPLTALLHCFDSVSNPWWLGGNILLGAPAGMEIASRLGARAWISTHDGDKIVKGIATGFLRTRKWREEDVLGAMSSAELTWRREKKKKTEGKMAGLSSSTVTLPNSPTTTIATTVTAEKVRICTDIIRLRSGEEVLLTNGPPTLMIDYDCPTTTTSTRVHDAPSIVDSPIRQTPALSHQQPDSETPPLPLFFTPPPRSPNRPLALKPLNSKSSLPEVSNAHPITHHDNHNDDDEEEEQCAQHQLLLNAVDYSSSSSSSSPDLPTPSEPGLTPIAPPCLSISKAGTRGHEKEEEMHDGDDGDDGDDDDVGLKPKTDEIFMPIRTPPAPPTPTSRVKTTTASQTQTQTQTQTSMAVITAPITTITTSTPTNITFPEIPRSFTGRRWRMGRNNIRGSEENNKIKSESGFASFEEIMMPMRTRRTTGGGRFSGDLTKQVMNY